MSFDTQIAEDAVNESVHYTKIVFVEGDQDVYDDLLAECDDYVDVDAGLTEFWGELDGSEWRVHVRRVTMA